jgi:hypothetical protein
MQKRTNSCGIPVAARAPLSQVARPDRRERVMGQLDPPPGVMHVSVLSSAAITVEVIQRWQTHSVLIAQVLRNMILENQQVGHRSHEDHRRKQVDLIPFGNVRS